MTELNLPHYDVKIRGTRQKPEIYDFLRRRFVALTPEEWVRQHFTHFLVEHMGYPQALLGNEIELHAGSKRLRCDSILYDEQLKPRVILEYKAPSVALTQKVFNQISTYNFLLHVDYLMVSNGLDHFCCRMDYEQHSYHFLETVPTYSEL